MKKVCYNTYIHYMTKEQLKKREKTIQRIHKKLLKQSAPAEDGYALVEPMDKDIHEELVRLAAYQTERYIYE